MYTFPLKRHKTCLLWWSQHCPFLRKDSWRMFFCFTLSYAAVLLNSNEWRSWVKILFLYLTLCLNIRFLLQGVPEEQHEGLFDFFFLRQFLIYPRFLQTSTVVTGGFHNLSILLMEALQVTNVCGTREFLVWKYNWEPFLHEFKIEVKELCLKVTFIARCYSENEILF